MAKKSTSTSTTQKTGGLYDYVNKNNKTNQSAQASSSAPKTGGLYDYVNKPKQTTPSYTVPVSPLQQAQNDAQAAQAASNATKKSAGIGGKINRFGNWFSNYMDWVENNPNLGYATDELSAAQLGTNGERPTLKSLIDQNKLAKDLDYQSWLKNREAQQKYKSAQEANKISLELSWIGSDKIQDLVDNAQDVYDRAVANGNPQAKDFKKKLDYYKSLLNQQNTYEQQQQWKSEWDAEHRGNNTDFQRYQTLYNRYGQAYEDNPEDFYGGDWDKYEEWRKLYGDTTMQSEASKKEAEAHLADLRSRWDELSKGREYDYEKDPEYNAYMAEAKEWADENLANNDWTQIEYDQYMDEQKKIADQQYYMRSITGGSDVYYAPSSEMEELAKEIEKYEYLTKYADEQFGKEAQSAATYAAMSGDESYAKSVAAGKQTYEESMAGLEGMPSQIAKDERDAKWQEYYDDAIADGMGKEDAEDLADYLTNDWWNSRTAEASRWDPEFHDERHKPGDAWTDQEKNGFYYILDQYGEDTAAKYAVKVNAAKEAEKWYDDKMLHDEYFAERHPVLATAMSRLGLLTSGYDWMKMVAEGTYNNGEVIYSLYEGLSRDADVFTSTVANMLADKGDLNDLVNYITGKSADIPYLGGKTLGDLYQSASSAMDSTLAYLISGGNPAAMNGLFFGASAASNMREALENGMDFNDAALYSAASGFAEAFGETVSIEFLFSKSGAEWMKAGIMAMLGPQLVEGSEEIVTGLVDRYFDDLINGADSKYNASYRAYLIATGSEEEARKMADRDFWSQLGDQAFMAMTSIAMTQGVHIAPAAIRTGAQMVTDYKTGTPGSIDPQSVFDAAAQQNPNSTNKAVPAFVETAERYKKRWENKGKISNYGMGKMMGSYAQAIGVTDYMSNPESRDRVQAWLEGLEKPQQQEAVVEKPGVEKTLEGEGADSGTGGSAVDLTPRPQKSEAAVEKPGVTKPSTMTGERTDESTGGSAVDLSHKPQKGEAAVEKPGVTKTLEGEGTDAGTGGSDVTTAPKPQQREAAVEKPGVQKSTMTNEQTDSGTGGSAVTFAQNLDKADAILNYAQGNTNESPIEGMTQEQAQAAVIDLAEQFGLQTGQPGLRSGTKFDNAIQRARTVLGALRNIENRRSERQAQIKKTEEYSKVTKAEANTVETDDGKGKITSAYYNSDTGNVELTVQGENGQQRTIPRSELTGEANELFQVLEDNLGKFAADAYNIMNDGQNAGFYASDFRTVMEYGRLSKNGNVGAILNDSRIRGILTNEQVQTAYKIGQGITRYEGGTPTRSFRGTGRVTMDGGIVDGHRLQPVKDKEALRNSQDYKEVQAIAKALDIDVVFYESQTEGDRYVGMQGAYQNGVIYLDVNAGLNKVGVGKRMFATTLSHELTHFIAQNAPKQYEALQDRVTQYLMLETGESFGSLVRQKMARADGHLKYDAAVEEVIADACETMLFHSETVQDMAQKDRGLFDTIKGFIDRFCNQILARHAEAKAIQPIIKEVQKLWDNALKQAVENRGAAVENPADAVTEGKGATMNEATGTAMASLRTFDESGRDTLNDFLNKRVEEGALEFDDAKEIMDQLDTLYKICREYDNGQYAPFSAWSDAEVVTYDGRPVFSVVKANGEYKLNLDFSLVCKKRRTLDAVFNEMIQQGIMDDFDMVQESIAKINDIIRENGFETACGLCFVDSKRYRQGMIADAFVMMYNTQVSSLVKKGSGQKVDYFNYGGDQTIQNSGMGIDTLADSDLDWTYVDQILKTEKPTTVKYKIANYLKNNPDARKRVRRGDFMSTAGFDALNAQNPELLSLYNSKKGAGGPKAAQSDVQYLNEIIGSKAFNAKAAYEVGGVRIQSFSDYVGRLVFDYVQMVADLSAKQLPAHSYTKEYMFAQQFGLTGIKINMSLVPEIIENGIAPGLDANGNYAWKDGQSFGSTVYDNNGKRMTAAEGFELAKKIQNAKGYSRNCGTIAVGVSDAHINKMLDDPEIRMIIPYHKSSLNHIVAAMMNIDKYEDYTLQQNTREKKNGKWTKIAHSEEFNFNEALQQLGDAKAAANAYLDWCRENGYKPKFDQFAGNPNYYKLLEDYSCYDKDGTTNAPMGAVEMRFPTENDAFGSMKDLIAEGLEEDAILQAKQEKAVPEIVRQIQEVLPEFEGTVRERNQKKKKASQKSTAKKETAKMSDREYMDAVERGDMDTAQRLVDEAAKAAGYNKRGFHGTTSKFWTFRRGKEGIHFGTLEQAQQTLEKDRSRTMFTDYPLGIVVANLDQFSEEKLYYIAEELHHLKYTGRPKIPGMPNIVRWTANDVRDYANKIFEAYPDARSDKISMRNLFNEHEDRMIDGYLKMQHPLVIPFDPGRWGPVQIANILLTKLNNEEGTYNKVDRETPWADAGKGTWKPSDVTGIELDESDRADLERIFKSRSDSFEDIVDFLHGKGVDSIEYTNMYEGTEDAPSYLLLDPEQVKLSDPVTYDDNGNVIPLSERFDTSKSDIRYSDRDVQSFTSKESIDAEIERLQDQIRDIQNAQWNAREAAKADPRVQEAQEKMWKAEDEKGRVGSVRERMEYNRILTQVRKEQAAEIPEGDLNELAQRIAELKELREQFLKVTTITDAQYNKLAKHFGTTTDYSVAGFILKDGRMLDFSGKKQYGNAYAGGREIYHNEVGDVLNLPTDTSPRIDMVSNGNIRLVPEINGINLSQKPTTQQKDVLRGLIDYYDGSVHVDIDNAAGRTVETLGYHKGTSASKILSDIDTYFETGEAPAPVSNLRAFYSERDDARTDRDLLMEAEEAGLSAAEKKALRDYRALVEDYEERERKVQAALDALEQMVRTHSPDVQKQRSKVSNLQAGMQKALKNLTAAEQGKALLEIIRKEREIQRKRTAYATRETFTKRDLRIRITKLYNDLNRRITNPSEKKNIPVPVMMQAIEVLEAINMDSSREGSKAGEKLRNKLLDLKQKYEALKNDQDFRSAAAYDPVVAELLSNMVEKIGETPINKMSAEQMRAVYEALTALDKVARKALKVKMLGEERDAYEVSKQMGEETQSVTKPHKNLFAQWINAQLSPERMFNRMGGYKMNGAWNQVYRMLDDGQLKQLQIQMEGTMIFDGLLKGKNYDRFIDPKETLDIGLKDKNGKAIPITRGMMVALYMHLQNEDNIRHIQYGGLTVPNLKDYYNRRNSSGMDSAVRAVGFSEQLSDLSHELRQAQTKEEKDAIRLQIEEVEAKADDYIDGLRQNIERKLNEYDRRWIAAAKELFDVYSKSRINETTMDVYGIKRANVDNYFPIWVDGDFLNTPFESIAKDMSLENAGFVKERVSSGKPIRLADVSDVASTQIRRVSQYCGLMPVVRNFQKIWGKVQTGYRGSLQADVRDKFGTAGIQYVENLMADLNGARKGKGGPLDELLNTLRGHMARASLTLSLRTALGQAASYPTAASVIGWDALGKALGQPKTHAGRVKRAELIQKYSPMMWYRMKGYSTTELGDIAGSNSKFDRLWKKAHMITGWIQGMDTLTVGKLWDAAEIYVADKNKALQRGSDGYYQEVAKVFNEIIEKSQPNYTTMQRPDILRNPSTLVRQLTMFLTQRLQNFNILYDSAASYSQARKDFKSGTVSAQQLGEARRNVRRAVVSQIVAAATIVAFKALADAILHSMNAYRDDDKELTKESISMELLDMFLDSLTGNMLGGSELYDIIESKVFGKTYYGVEISSISTVMDMVESANKFAESVQKGIEEGKSAKDIILSKQANTLAKNISTMLGIPLGNGEKIVNGMIYHIEDAMNGEFLHYEAGVERTTAQQAHRLYRAYASANFGTAKKIREQVGDDEKLNAALVTYIKKQYQEGKISKAEAQKELVKWAGKREQDATTMMREYSCFVETGIKYDEIGQQFVEGKITAAKATELYRKYSNLSKADIDDKIEKLKCEKATGIKYDKIDEMYVDGKITAAKAKSLYKQYGGMDEKDAEKKVQQLGCEKATGIKYSKIADELRDGKITESKAAKLWETYGGMDSVKAASKASFTVFQNKNPNTTLESSTYLTWYTKYSKIMDAKSYESYYTKMSACKGKDKDGDGKADAGTVKKQKLKIIDSLPISNKQKDELYLINGWSKNTIKDAPWHK